MSLSPWPSAANLRPRPSALASAPRKCLKSVTGVSLKVLRMVALCCGVMVARGVLDGHIVLSRRLAEEGHYPAIDIEASISRVMPSVVTPTHMARAQQFKQLWSRYQQSRDLISVGAYVAGGDRDTDLAIALQPQLVTYLRQGLNDKISMGESEAHLNSIFAPAPGG